MNLTHFLLLSHCLEHLASAAPAGNLALKYFHVRSPNLGFASPAHKDIPELPYLSFMEFNHLITSLDLLYNLLIHNRPVKHR